MSDSKETELERIARQAREFREKEAKRIAEEKEAAQLLALKKKEDELRRIASASGQTLEEAAKLVQSERHKRLSMLAMSKEELLQHDPNFSEKARLLLEREEALQKQLEEEAQRTTPSKANSPRRKNRESYIKEEQTPQSPSDDKRIIPDATTSATSRKLDFDGVDVSGHAKKFSEKEEAERRRLEEEAKLMDGRKKVSPQKRDFAVGSSDVISSDDEGETFYDASSTAQEFVFNDKVESPLGKPVKNSEKAVPKAEETGTTMEPQTIQQTRNVVSAKVTAKKVTTEDEQEVQPKADASGSWSLRFPISWKAEKQPTEKTEVETVATENGRNEPTQRIEPVKRATEPLKEAKSNVFKSETLKENVNQVSPQPTSSPRSAVETMKATSTLSSTREVAIPAMDEHYIQTLVVRRRDQTSGVHSRKRKGVQDGDDSSDIASENGRKEANFEIPIAWNQDGTFEVLRDVQVSMSAHIPPSRVQGRWSGTLEGSSTLGGNSSENAAGSITLDYKASTWSRLSLGLIRGHELFHPMISLGGSLVREGSTVGATFFHNASFLHAMMLEHSMYSLFFRHHFPKSKWILSSQLSRRQELSLSLSNSKISGRAACNLKKPEQVDLRLDLRPKISEDRRAHMYCQWKLGVWQLGASLVQSLHSQVATVGLGVRVMSSRGLEWMLSWSRGNATVRVPIIISRGLQNVQLTQVLYFSLLSFLIEEGIADLWGWKNSSETEPQEDEPVKASEKKGRENAELQRRLMERQAKRKTRNEEEKDGLVIHNAVYQVKGGEDWDVTIPLQFWVTNSSLNLASTSKSQLLGFYDLTDKREKTLTVKASVPDSWWKDTWNDLLDLKAETKQKASRGPCPTLAVQYDFKGQKYSMTVSDTEELLIPNPKATLLSNSMQ